MTLPAAPVLLLGQTLRQRELLQPVGVARKEAQEAPPGLLLSWDHVHDRGIDEGRQNAAPLAPVLADPGACAYNRATIARVPAAGWIVRPPPSSDADWDRTIDDAVAAQRALGVDALILPGVALNQADWPDGLQAALDAARRAHRRRQSGDPEPFVRVCVSDVWLSDVRLRRTLLNQFTDLPDDLGAALHLQWARGGPLDDRLLGALQTVVSVLAEDGRRVLMIESGTVGWLAIGWGAWGYTAGVSQATWHRSTQEIRRRAGQPAPRVQWFFERQLLHHIRRRTHQRIALDQRYERCNCVFCRPLLPAGGGQWDFNLASQHALHALAELTSRVAAPQLSGRRARVQSIIEQALSLSAHLRLQGAARPSHLELWLRQL